MPSEDTTVVITGVGWISPWACGSGAEHLAASPAAPPRRSDDGRWLVPDAELGPDPRKIPDSGGDRAALLAAPALRHAATDAGLDLARADPTRVGLVLGSAFAALADMMQFAGEVIAQSPRFVSPIHFPHTVGNYAAGAVARSVKINGPNLTLGQGPESGILALNEAASLLIARTADIIFAGGVDTIDPALLPGLVAAGRARVDGPFAAQPAEAACLLCLETHDLALARGAKILGAIGKSAPDSRRIVVAPALCGDPHRDQHAADAARTHLPGKLAPTLVVSARHLLGNAFAAAAAAQVALALAALTGRPTPAWNLERTALDRRELTCVEPAPADAALILGPSDVSTRPPVLWLRPSGR